MIGRTGKRKEWYQWLKVQQEQVCKEQSLIQTKELKLFRVIVPNVATREVKELLNIVLITIYFRQIKQVVQDIQVQLLSPTNQRRRKRKSPHGEEERGYYENRIYF